MYCTLADLLDQIPEEKLVQLTDDEGTGEIAEPIVDKAIDNATAEIDAYAQTQYSVPFSPVPKIVGKVAVDITLYNLFSRRGFDTSEESPDSIIGKRYKDAIKFLENLAKGVVTIGPAAESAPQPATIQGPPRMFTRDKMRGY